MSVTTDDELEDIDLEEEDEQQTPTPQPEPEPLTPEQQRDKDVADRQNALIESNARTATSIEQLMALGQQWITAQNKPAAPAPAAPVNTDAVLEDFGKRINDAIIAGDGKQIAQLFVQGADGVAQQRLKTALEQYGAPLAEKAGEFTVGAFLTKMREEAGTNGAKTHDLAVKHFELGPEERTWLATAAADQANAFLRRKYKEAMGDVLMTASRKARPQNIAPGSGGSAGGNAGGGPIAIPGLTARQVKEQMKLMEIYWPDAKVREQKLKALQASMGESR